MATMTGIKDKVIIITGASMGIGAAMASAFAAEGSKLVLAARTEEKLKEVAETCVKAGLQKEKILVVPADVTRETDVSKVIQSAVQNFQTIDVLINNAGGTVSADFEHTTLAQFDDMMALNLRSVFMMSKAALPHLLQSKGQIINISTFAATRPCPEFFTYCVAKAGVDHLTRNVAKELGPKGVRVNAISPGVIRTNVLQTYGAQPSEEEREKMLGMLTSSLIPARRIGAPEEVASMAVFLASDKAAYVTGTTMLIDGGIQLAA